MHLEEDILLQPFTTFHIGGPARFFVRVETTAELLEALAFAKEKNLPLFILGGGSNVLIAEEGFPGLVIKIELRGISFTDRGEKVEAIVAAGEVWDVFVEKVVAEGFFGIENLSGIPGTVGGTPIQNVGAYGAEVGQIIQWVEAVDTKSGELVTLSNGDCHFSYRSSFFKSDEGRRFIITRVCFSLGKKGIPNLSYRDVREFFAAEKNPNPSLTEVRDAILAIRARKFPDLTKVGTAGSFFKNPIVTAEQLEPVLGLFPDLPHTLLPSGEVKIALGGLLDRLGWKGIREGDTGVFPNQELVLVNYGGAKAGDIVGLASRISADVKKKTGITIAPEIIFVGEPH